MKNMRAGKWVFAFTSAVMFCVHGETATYVWATTPTDYPGAASRWTDGVIPASGDDVVFPLTENSSKHLTWLDNTNSVNLGTVSATGYNWVMQFCDSTTAVTDSPHDFSIYDARDFHGWFRSLHPNKITFPATSSHTPVIQRFEVSGRVRFGVPDAGTKAVISNLFGQGTVKVDAGDGELELARTSGDLLGIKYNKGKLTLHSPAYAGETNGVEAIIAKAATHFDAQAYSTFTFTDGKVTEWRDPEKPAIKAIPFDGVMRYGTYQSYIPIPAPTYVADWRGTGKPVVDFGPYASTSRIDFATCGASALRFVNGSSEWRNNMEEVFVVFADNDSCARASFINDSFNVTFPRGQVNSTYIYNSRQTGVSEYGGLMRRLKARSCNAKEMSVNGCPVPSTHSVAGSKLKVIAMNVGLDGNVQNMERRVGAIGRSSFEMWGGVAVGEVLCFTTALTDAERQTLVAYLKKRWLAEDEQDPSTVGELEAAGNATIGVPEGETAVVRHYVNRGTVSLAKEDGGNLLIGDTSVNQLSVDVAGGNVGFSTKHVYDASAPAANPSFHFDASDIDSFTFNVSNEVRYVVRWEDQNDPQVAAVPVTNLYLKTTKSGDATMPALPFYLADDCNGLPAVSFGPLRTLGSIESSGYQDSAALVFRDTRTNSNFMRFREGFAVVKICSAPSVFGTDWTLQNMHPTGWCFADCRYNEDSYIGGSWAINGEVFDAQDLVTTYYPDVANQYIVVRVSAGKGQSVSAMALDRINPGSLGGMKISEYIVYDHGLSDVERVNTEAYLMRKWLGMTHPYLSKPSLKKVSYAEGLVAEIPVASTARIDQLTVPSGTIAKIGPGTLAVGLAADTVHDLSVEEGELSIDGALMLSNVLDRAAFHVDASATNSIEFAEGSDTVVERWNDVRGATYGYASHWGIWGGKPSYVKNALNGLPVVDFGTYRFTNGQWYWINSQRETASNVCAAVTDGSGLLWNRQLNLKEGFQVFKLSAREGNSSAPPVVGAQDACNFHPHQDMLISFNGENAHTNLKVVTEWSLDKEFFDIHTQTWANVDAENTYHLYSFSVTNTVNSAAYPLGGAFAYERRQGAGGMKLAEGVFFTKSLTVDERRAVRNYLLRKWKCESLGTDDYTLDSLHVAAGAKVSLSGDGVATVASCDVSGTVSGTLAFSEGGTLNVTYTGAGLDAMTVSGSVTLPAAGNVVVTIADGAKPVAGSSMEIITADAISGGVSGWGGVTLQNADGTDYSSCTALLSCDVTSLRITFVPKATIIIIR